MQDLAAIIAENVARVKQQIATAATRAGRKPEEVTLVAVTKYVGLPEAEAVVAAGCRNLGESRPQELWSKAAELSGVQWHLVGHLQRNKVRRTLPLVHLIHSVDSPRLLEEIDAESARLERQTSVLLEVNISGEAAKHGFQPEGLEAELGRFAQYQHVAVRGLMGMAALEGGLDVARRNFAQLRELRDRLQAAAPAGIELTELSMGMSGDFGVAIEEGSTLVRVGSSLFEGLES